MDVTAEVAQADKPQTYLLNNPALAGRQESVEDAKRIQTLLAVAHYLLSVSTMLVAALLVLGEVGISLAPILGAAGIVGIAVGFGAQTLVKDYVS
ncbi:MAG: hypothetical protein EBW74_08070, partial [Betaproteobacteria bacterium]|nr:hypothetical protein [Betaproteobacteria bacterium]